MRARRSLAAAALVTIAFTATACGGSTDNAGNGAGADGPAKDGGAITIRGCTPENPLIGSNTTEVCGGNVIDAVTSKLVRYNSDTAAPENDLAESIETTDNKVFTVKLKKDRKFSDGTPVQAKNFVDAWNFAAYAPNGQQNGYFFEPVAGFADLQCPDEECKTKPKTNKLPGLKVVDDSTFTITTSEAVSNLPVRLGYSAFVPQPDAFFTDPKSTEFGKMPVGAGPFKVTSNTATEIVLEKNPEYTGDFKAHVDKVTYRIYNDAAAAYTEVVADQLDFTDIIPSDQLAGDQWKAQLGDRTVVRDSGVHQTLTFTPNDEQLKKPEIRKAISQAIDRKTITEKVFNGTRTPATSWVSPVVDGYKEGACGDACTFDKDAAKKAYDAAGGYKGVFQISVNGDGGHKLWADAVCNQLKSNLGMNCQVNTTPDFKTLRTQIKAGELKGAHRSGWQMDYPSIENFLTPLYTKNAASNDAKYDNPAFDKKLVDAAAAKTPGEANTLYQEAEAMLSDGLPVIPLWSAATPCAWSTKVTNVKVTPFGTLDMSSISVK
ncbi:MAG: ABC transporter substrate-binding protein [Luteococcus sp.]|uniref:peptide ABC transporter substrate-binding protein n=1 Tax=Luteococcus sp. TaxID=1969402 RepID=UPI0026498472|nr:ABC transporter substrate-binding protein [Luteococcus sp.]MDN5563484.1 ABC transporter substrate-binding protein [Luteococcus sp.]